jgi:hypothetical protein
MSETSIAARAAQLIETWGRSRALEMATRYVGEAERTRQATAIALHSAVRDEVQWRLSLPRSSSFS